MKNLIFIFGLFFIMISCEPKFTGNPDRFKTGIFEAPAVEGQLSKTTIIRTDSLQIEKYTKYIEISTDSGVYIKEENRIDSFSIQWKNNFFYTCKMVSPKTDFDKNEFFYQITKVTDSTYDFSLKIGYSKYTQTGTVTKIK